jgi:hypothetical protein
MFTLQIASQSLVSLALFKKFHEFSSSITQNTDYVLPVRAKTFSADFHYQTAQRSATHGRIRRPPDTYTLRKERIDIPILRAVIARQVQYEQKITVPDNKLTEQRKRRMGTEGTRTSGCITFYNYHNFVHYPPSYLLFKTQHFGDWIGFCLRFQVEPTQMGPIEI